MFYPLTLHSSYISRDANIVLIKIRIPLYLTVPTVDPHIHSEQTQVNHQYMEPIRHLQHTETLTVHFHWANYY